MAQTLYCLVQNVLARIQIVEVGDEPGAVEDAAAQIAQEAGGPSATEQAAAVAHRILAAHAGPVGQRRAGKDQRPDQIRAHAGGHYGMPTGLAVPEHQRLRDGVGLQLDHLLQEHGKCVRNIFDRLTFHRVDREADGVDRMFRFEGLTDLAYRLESPNARPLAGTRVDHDHRGFGVVNHRARGRHDPHQGIVHRSRQAVPSQDNLVVVDRHGVDRPGSHLRLLVAGPPENIEEDERTLPKIGGILGGRAEPHGRPSRQRRIVGVR